MSGHSKTPEAAMAAYQSISEQPTLTEFLLERIEEAEEIATLQRERLGPPTNGTIIGVWLNSRWHPTCDPARVLADVEAKRRIVEHCEFEPLTLSPGDPYVLQLLALPYADHPDYDDERWRP